MRWMLLELGLIAAFGLAAMPVRGDELLARRPSAEETARIIAHGPWPPPGRRDVSNRASGNPSAIAFGRRMFHEPRLSANGYIACVTCHQTNRGWTDGIARARALAPVDRNTPAITNAALNTWFGWRGTSDSLWMASVQPMLDPREMGSSAAQVAHVVRIGDGLACEYERAFGRPPQAASDETVMVDVAKAIAAFAETLTTGRTPFDDYRDALARGDERLALRYPAAAARGARLFVGRGDCARCHAGPNFTDGSFRAGVGGGTDAGRLDGVRNAPDSRYSLAGPFNDDPFHRSAVAAPMQVLQADRQLHGPIRVPSLRNAAVTPPYMHDGSRETLRDAVRHDAGVTLSEADVEDLIAFLATLTDRHGAERPNERPSRPACE